MLGAMRKTKEVLDKYKIPFWLDCGTLLFAYRDHESNPEDIDFAVQERDVEKLLSSLAKFTKDGFEIHRVYTHRLKGIVLVSLRYDGLPVDIFVKFFNKDYAFTISPNGYEYVIGKQPKKYFEPLVDYEFDGLKWKIPNNTEKYLSIYYGNDWRTHKPKWDWTKDAACIDTEFDDYFSK